jgi:hypothetical protein
MSFLRFVGVALGAAFVWFVLPYATLLLAVDLFKSMGLFGLLLALLTGLWIIWMFIKWVFK